MDNTTVHPLSRDLAYVIELFLFKGRPKNRDPDRKVVVLINHGYAVGFSPDRLQPLWAAYRVAGSDRDVDFDRPHLYYEDTRLDREWRIGTETFGRQENVQYHVGHMVPNEVINRQFGRLAQMETFLMSNMSPQRGSLNTGVWLRLENMIRNIKDTPKKDHVWAIAGPIFCDDPKLIRPPNGKMADVYIDGSASDAISGIDYVNFTVDDEYNLVEPMIGWFGAHIQLEAARDGNDKDGRLYTITVETADYAGNQSSAQAFVTVPH